VTEGDSAVGTGGGAHASGPVSRSLLVTGPRHLAWEERTLPSLGAHDVLVETRAGAISIGSELPHYLGTARHSTPDTYPLTTGYESLGVVATRGRGVRRLREGDRVVAFYGHRTRAVVPEDKVIVVPPGVGDEEALLAILSCDVAKGIRKVQPWIGEPTLVTGAGAIGLLTVWVLGALGATQVDVCEPLAARRALARSLGARRAVDPAGTPGEAPYAVGVECSSRDAAFALLQEHLRPNGRVCILADGNVEPLTLTPAFHEKELLVVGSSDGWDYQAHATWYFDVLSRGGSALAHIFDLEVPVSALAQTLERLATDNTAAIKVCVRY